jgi:hypothetical protein
VETRTLAPRYFVETRYKVLSFLMRFMSNARIEKLIESLYCGSTRREPHE